MRPSIARLLVVSIVLAAVADSVAAMDTIWPAATVPRQVSVTSDSAPGWTPSLRDEADVRTAIGAFLAAKDEGHATEAYAMLSEIDKEQQPFADFASAIQLFNHKAGPVLERRVVAVNWTKNPTHAPAPGTYAAVDIVSRFKEVDHDCGYVILFQAPSGGDYRIMREEDNVFDNATARTMTPAQADAIWAKLSANCPNYAAAPPPIPEQQNSSIGYKTVDLALRGLRAKPDVRFSSQGGWTVAEDPAASTMWSFAPSGDPAYPAVAKRRLISTSAGVSLEMDVLCESTKAACDNFVRQFKSLNAQMAASLQKSSPSKTAAGPLP